MIGNKYRDRRIFRTKEEQMLQLKTAPTGVPLDSEINSTELMGLEERLEPPILLQYWQVVLRWKWVIAGIIGAALVVGLVATLLTTPKYSATTRIEISREQKNFTKVEGLESGEAGRDLEF